MEEDYKTILLEIMKILGKIDIQDSGKEPGKSIMAAYCIANNHLVTVDKKWCEEKRKTN